MEQKRDNADAKVLKQAMVDFLEMAFFFKLHNLWFNINASCLRASRVGRSRWNLVNRSDAERQQITTEAKTRLQKLYQYVRDESALREMTLTYELHFQEATKKLDAFLKSPDCWTMFEKWTTTLNIDPSDYPEKFEIEFFRFLEEIVDHWEEKNGFFRRAQIESKKELSKVVGEIEEQRSQVEQLLSGDGPQKAPGPLSGMSTREKIIVGITSPIWIPIVIIAIPIVLAITSVASFKESRRKAAKREAYEKDKKRQKLEDARELLTVISAEALTKKMFLSSENFMKQVISDLAIRIGGYLLPLFFSFFFLKIIISLFLFKFTTLSRLRSLRKMRPSSLWSRRCSSLPCRLPRSL